VNDAPTPRFSPLALLIAAAVAVLAAGLGGVAAHRTTGPLRSTALVAFDEPLAVAAAANGGVLEKLSRIRFKYVGLIPTDRLALPVADLLSVPADQVRGRLSAVAASGDLLLRVTCTGAQPAPTRRCADALARALVTYVDKEQSTGGIPVTQRLVVTQVQPAIPAFRPRTGLARPLGVAALSGGLAAAVVLALALRRRD
jgi:hypothetical protein